MRWILCVTVEEITVVITEVVIITVDLITAVDLIIIAALVEDLTTVALAEAMDAEITFGY